MELSQYTERILLAARRARSEAKLEGECNQALKECLGEFGIEFDPHVNETLKNIGLAQVDSSRPDGVFGHIVYDYKSPGVLATSRGLEEAKAQIEGYLDTITEGHLTAPEECGNWFGYVCDGSSLTYCRSNRRAWQWSRLLPMSDSVLLLLVHAYRSLGRKPLTAQLLSQAFGKDGDVAREAIRVMCSHLAKPRHKTNMLFREWKRLFEQVSTYALEQLPSLRKWSLENGIATQDASHILFAMHSYYSLVVKILTSELLSISTHNPTSVCDEMVAADGTDELYRVLMHVENGDYYERYRISNFLEGDFFSWYTNERSKPLAEAIRAIAREFLAFEPASAILLPEAKRDLLKEFYSSLVDEQIRHDLGEYYTPDWLAQHVLDQAGYDGNPNLTVLDPACGSGTFLVESIGRLKDRCAEQGMSPLQTLERVLRNVKGLDLNPLAVISARANYILSIYDLVFDLGYDIELPVYLADAVNIPLEKSDLTGDRYLEYRLDTEVGQFILEIPWEFVHHQVLGKVLLVCEEAILHRRDFAWVLQRLGAEYEIAPLLRESVSDRLERFFDTVRSLERREWDKIWCRIIKNNFSAKGFAPFHFVVGNPPWVRWSRLPEAYRARVKAFCKHYGLVSGRGYSGGIESDISTVITFSAADNWLADGGVLAILITWTVFKSASAKGFRLSRLPRDHGLRLLRIEDLTRIQPFPDATNETAVYIAKKVRPARTARFERIGCGIWTPPSGGVRISPSASLVEVTQACRIREGAACPVAQWGSPLFTGDISDFTRAACLRGSSTYLGSAHRGTISDCARVYWLKVLKYSPENNRVLVRTLTENELPRARRVTPVEGAWIEADLLYPLIRGRDLGRYSWRTEGWYQLIPNSHYEKIEPEEQFADRYPLTYSYLKNYEALLLERASYRRYQRHLPFYVIYCVGEYSFAPFKVIWMEQQDPRAFRASVISRVAEGPVPNTLTVPDHKLYFVSLKSETEAHYVCGFLNSLPVRTWLGGFLHGKQIATSIFEFMEVPAFDPKDTHCVAISDISRDAHAKRAASRTTNLLSTKEEEKLGDHVRALCEH